MIGDIATARMSERQLPKFHSFPQFCERIFQDLILQRESALRHLNVVDSLRLLVDVLQETTTDLRLSSGMMGWCWSLARSHIYSIGRRNVLRAGRY